MVNNAVVHSRYKIKKADWITFTEETRLNALEIEHNLTSTEDGILNAASKSIPKQTGNKKQSYMNNWWNDDIESLRKDRIKARKRWVKNRHSNNRMEYNRCNATLRKAITEAKRKSRREFVGSMNINTPSSTVWKKFKATNGESSRKIHSLKLANGVLLIADQEKANVFSKHYSNLSGKQVPWPMHLTKEEQFFTCRMELLCLHEDMDNEPFTMKELTNALAKINCSSPGADDIHNEMLKNCSQRMLSNILNLFNDVWKTGEIPQKWKTARIIPIHKPGKDESQLESYRPISLTSCLGKLMERLVNARLTWRLENDDKLSNLQFGFRRQRSTADALLYFTDQIYEGFERKKATIAVMIDYEAAFDKIPHATVILQCMKLGIKGKMLKYIVSYLKNRCIQVDVNGTISLNHIVANGIPQGGIICPTLFNIALHDFSAQLPPGVSSCTFADDCTIWASDEDHLKAINLVQLALHRIMEWCGKWSLKISLDKTECSFFTRRNNLANYIPQLQIQDIPVKFNLNPKLLGVVLDSKLRWAKQVDYVLEKCTSRLNALKVVASRNWGADTSTLRSFYLAFVCFKATYCCEVWGAAAKTHIDKIGRIQAAALRTCLGCPSTTPTSAMEVELGVEPIEIYIRRQMWTKYLRIQSSTPNHPLRCVINASSNIRNSFTCQIRSMASMLTCGVPETIPVTYDNRPGIWNGVEILMELPNRLTKDNHPAVLKSEALSMINELYDRHIRIFTDGSVDIEGRVAGAGYFNETTGDRYYVPANSLSSMDAELLAINAALTSCLSLKISQVCVLMDSRSALQAILNPEPTAYAFRILEIRRLLRELQSHRCEITLQWVPSHCDVYGNEVSGQIAKAASKMQPTDEKKVSLLHCRNQSNKYFYKAWSDKWNQSTVGRHLHKIQPIPTDGNLYKGVQRQLVSFAARARIGHIVTQKYLFRFNLTDSSHCALSEDGEEDLEHILLRCSYPILSRDLLRAEVNDFEDILKNKKHWQLACAAYIGHRAIGYD